MSIALTLQSYLGDHRIVYDVKRHERTSNSQHTAEICHVPGDRLAKGVVVKSGTGYLLAVLPASMRLAMEAVENVTGDLRAVEEDIAALAHAVRHPLDSTERSTSKA